MSFPKLNDLQVFSMLRVGCGLHFLVNQLFNQWPNFTEYFSSSGMVNPEYFNSLNDSLLFLIWEMNDLKFVLFGLTILFTMAFALGIGARIIHGPLFLLTLSFQLANPLVIHEPQQICQLLLLILWFVPYEQYYSILKTPGFGSYEKISVAHGRRIVFLLLGFLGYYYLMAGLKKLPDESWTQGRAVGHLITSPYLSLNNIFTGILKNSLLSSIATWGAIVFEISFIFLAFTKYKPLLVVGGVLFHLLIALTLDVGLFWFAMLMWYPLLFFRRDAKRPLVHETF